MEMEGPWELSVSAPENKYTYGGKEMQSDFGLDLLDFHNRLLDPSIGRFTSVDKLADHPNQIDKSVYAYAWNNPVLLTDPDGNCPSCFLKGVWNGVKNTVTGVANVVMHPIETVEAVGNAIMHPIETGEAIVDAVSTRVDEAQSTEGVGYELAGEIIFEVATVALSATKAAKISKLGKAGDGIEFTADLSKSKATSRSGHRNAGNKQINEAMNADPKLKKKMEKRLGKDVVDRTSTSGKGRKNPKGYEWDHNTNNKNQLDLRSKENHAKKTANDPGRAGGYAKFWKKKKK